MGCHGTKAAVLQPFYILSGKNPKETREHNCRKQISIDFWENKLTGWEFGEVTSLEEEGLREGMSLEDEGFRKGKSLEENLRGRGYSKLIVEERARSKERRNWRKLKNVQKIYTVN